MKIFVHSVLNEGLQRELRQYLPSNSEIVFNNNQDESALQDAFYSADIIMGNPPASWFNNSMRNLQFWQLDSAGFNQYQHLELTIPIANMGDYFAQQCAETAIGGLLVLYRQLNKLILLQQEKEWRGQELRSSMGNLGEKQCLILGIGTIGLAIKRILEGFGSRVKVVARRNPMADFRSFEDAVATLPETDVVINTLPGSAGCVVTENFIKSMKAGSIYANVGRGNTTDEKALIEALQNHHLKGAVLDVTAQEPLPVENPLWELDNVVITQHTAGGNALENEYRVRLFVSNLNSFIKGDAVQNPITLKQGY